MPSDFPSDFCLHSVTGTRLDRLVPVLAHFASSKEPCLASLHTRQEFESYPMLSKARLFHQHLLSEDLPNKHLLCTCSSVPVRCVLLKTHWIKNICQISKCKVKVRCQGCLRWVADTDGFLCTQGNTNEQFKIYNLQVLELLHFLGKKKLLLWTRCETGIWC